MKSFISNISNLPVAVSGLALGIAGIGNVIKLETNNHLYYLCITIAVILLILITIKKLSHPKLLLNELAHPAIGSFIPTFDMALVIIANSLALYYPLSGQILWCFALVLHLLYTVYFIYYRSRNFNLNDMLPSWFLPPVGIAIACLNNSNIHLDFIAHSSFYMGLILYFIMLPIMFYRLIFRNKLQKSDLPSFAMMEAPSGLCLMTYLVGFTQHNQFLIDILLVLSITMTSLVYISMFWINPVKIKFSPTYTAFTFSMAISAGAFIEYSYYRGVQTNIGHIWHIIGLIEMIIAICVITWVFIKMVPIIIKIIIK